MITHTSSAIAESSPVVGSSRKRTGGRVMSESPMFTRFFCPPEMPVTSSPPMTVLRHSSSRSWLITSSQRSSCCARVSAGSFSSAVYMSICSTVRTSTRLSNCST